MALENQQQHPGSQKPAALVYRGDNPLCVALSARLSDVMDSIRIDADDDRLGSPESIRNFFEPIGEKYQSIFSDYFVWSRCVGESAKIKSVYRILSELHTEEGKKPYDFWLEQVKAVFDYFRGSGKQVVILDYGIKDHCYEMFNRGATDVGIALHIHDNLLAQNEIESDEQQTPTIPKIIFSSLNQRDFSRQYRSRFPNCGEWEQRFRMFHNQRLETHGTIQDALDFLGVEPDNAVIVGDHHVYYLRGKAVEDAGFDHVDFHPICPCCVGLEPHYLENLIEHGFKIPEVPAEVKAQYIPLDKLADKIRRMISEIEFQ